VCLRPFCPFSFGHCIVFPSSNCGFWLPLWVLQTFLTFVRDPNRDIPFQTITLSTKTMTLHLSYMKTIILPLSTKTYFAFVLDHNHDFAFVLDHNNYFAFVLDHNHYFAFVADQTMTPRCLRSKSVFH